MKSYSVTDNYIKAKEEYIDSELSAKYVCDKYHISHAGFSHWLSTLGYNTKTKLKKSKIQFDIIDTEEKAYWLGFLYGDGCINYGKRKGGNVELSLAEIDKHHIEKFRDFLGDTKELKYRSKVKAYRYTACSKYLCESLIKLGCVPAKSLILKFPTEEQVPKNLRNAFVRGYYDADGCISISNKGKTFYFNILGTYEFLEEILKEYDLSIDIIKKDIRRINSNNFYIYLRQENAYNFLNEIYKDSTVYLERKYNKYLFFKDYFENKSLANIKNKKVKVIKEKRDESIVCLNDNLVFKTIKEASKFYKINYSVFWKHFKGNKPVHGLEFKQNI